MHIMTSCQQDHQTSRLLSLPGEILDLILYHVTIDASRTTLVASTASRKGPALHVQPNLENYSPANEDFFSVFLVCRALHHRATRIFHENLLLDLTYDFQDDNAERAISPLVRMGPTARNLLAHVRIRAYSEFDAYEMPFCEWRHMLTLIARDCQNLKSLSVMVPAGNSVHDPSLEATVFASSCNAESPWVMLCRRLPAQTVLCLEVEDSGWSEHTDALEAIKLFQSEFACLSRIDRVVDEEPQVETRQDGSFNFLGLPRNVQECIIRNAVIPKHRFVHPCLHPALDETTSTALSLMLTCRNIHNLTEEILYSEAIFSSCYKKYEKGFITFMRKRTSSQLLHMQRFYSFGLDHWIDRRFDKWRFTTAPHIEDLERKIHMQEMHHPCFGGLQDPLSVSAWGPPIW